MTIKDALDLSSEKIDYIEANVLLEYVLNADRNYIIANKDKALDKEQEELLLESLKKLESGVPLQYITSKANFMGLEFYVNQNVLIPQPDTEILVEEALKIINKSTKTLKVLDLCTGSGAIAVSIVKYATNVQICASDISESALEVAKMNYERLINNVNYEGLVIANHKDKINSDEKDDIVNRASSETSKIKFIISDVFDNIKGKFDLIISNPPYIKTEVIKQLSKEVQNEPRIALDGGEDGLKFYKIIRENVEKFLAEDGTLLMEIGYDQKEEVQKLFENSKCVKDLAGNDRVIIWRN